MENLDILKGVVSDETFAKLEEETKDSPIKLGDLSTGKYVSEDKYKGLATELATAKTDLATANKNLADTKAALVTKTTEYDTLKGETTDSAATIASLKATHEQEIEALKKDNEAELARLKIRAKIAADYHPNDVDDIMRHIDVKKCTVDGDKIDGLSEQVEPLRESKPYYFVGGKGGSTGLEHSGGGKSGTVDSLEGAITNHYKK